MIAYYVNILKNIYADKRQVNKQYKFGDICVTKVTLLIGDFGTSHVGSFSNPDISFCSWL